MTGDVSTRAQRTLIVAAAIATLVAGGIHLGAADAHLSASRLSGGFFLVVGLAQAVWASLVLRRPRPAVVLAGIAGSAAVVGVWLASRTTGLPLGPHPWEPETVGAADALASALEVAVVVLAGRALIEGRARGMASLAALRDLPPGLTASFGALAATVAGGTLAPVLGSHHAHGAHGVWLFHLIALVAMVTAVLTVLGEAFRIRPTGRQTERRST